MTGPKVNSAALEVEGSCEVCGKRVKRTIRVSAQDAVAMSQRKNPMPLPPLRHRRCE